MTPTVTVIEPPLRFGPVDDRPTRDDPFARRLDQLRTGPGGRVPLFRYSRAEDRIQPPTPAPYSGTLLPDRRQPDRTWDNLAPVRLDPDRAAERHLIAARPDDTVGTLFDMLRTRMVQELADRNWTRVAVSGPTRGCGSSFVAANLALSLSRLHGCRTVLADMDLRHPSLADLFGMDQPGALRDMLTGDQPVESHLRRLGPNLALALNGHPETDAAEVLQDRTTAETLAWIEESLSPTVMLFDLPPMLSGDDAMAFLPLVDCVLLVSNGEKTLPQEMEACEKLLRPRSQLLGVVLNCAEDKPRKR